MKTKILLATLLMLALPMTAKNKKEQNKFAEQKARLTGIWQQCLPMTTNDGGHQIRFLPHFKILSSDGTFSNMSQANSVAPAALFTTGEWRVTSDSTFVEHIATNANSVYEGKDNELTFRLPMGNQVLEVFYTMPGDTRRIREAWIRVQKGNAAAIAQKYFERLNGIKSGGNDTPKNQQNLIIEEPQGSDENLSLTENPRGIYTLMGVKGKRLVKPYFSDLYKICTDSVTMRFLINDRNPHLFRIDVPDFQVFNYTGEKTENNETDKSIRIFDSNSKRFTQKWWSTLSNHPFYPDNDWAYEYYESGNYTEASKPIFDALTSAPAREPNNPLIGTWQYLVKMEKLDGVGQDNWIDELKKVDNLKETLAYLRQTEPENDFVEYCVYTPSRFFTMGMRDKSKGMMGGYDRVTYNGKDAVVDPNGEVMKIHWLTDDMYAVKINAGNKVLYRIWERVTDNDSMLSRICSLFLNGNKPK